MRVVHLPVYLCAMLILVISMAVSPSVSAQDEFDMFTNAKNAYAAGEYETAVDRFENLLKKQPTNEGLLVDTHKFLGVSYLFLGDENDAGTLVRIKLSSLTNDNCLKKAMISYFEAPKYAFMRKIMGKD